MAAKGTQLKKEITNKILEVFPNSFVYNDGKEIRICGVEDGNDIQIKCVLTCAKENVSVGADTAIPGSFPTPNNAPVTPVNTEPIKPTAEEKQAVAQMLKNLGL